MAGAGHGIGGLPSEEEMFLSILSELETPMDVNDLYNLYGPEAAPNQVSVYLTVLRKSKLVDVEIKEIDGRQRPIWKINDEGRKFAKNLDKYEFPNPWDNPDGTIKLKES